MAAGPTARDIEPPSAARHHILGTAGHIDHGKTSLVRVLTGTDTDRLPEERRRGMTIELGFAALTIGDATFGIVDVPGHERFVRTMVAGATGIDIALIVVAADDSVMPQTTEHVEVLHLLGVKRGVVAVTKIDIVDDEMVELVIDDIHRLLAGTPLQDAPICPVSSTTGEGTEELKQQILKVSQTICRATPRLPFRMAIDRVFSVRGRGTVVTGSVLRGIVSEGDVLEVWPAGDKCRVRGLQSHGVYSQALAVGQRAALNLSGVDRESLMRGAQLATPGYLDPSRMVDVRLHYLSSCGRPLKSTSVVRLEVGTSDIPVRVVLVVGDALQPGESALAQLRSGEPIATAFGQRFIIRDENATRTIGGGVVLRPIAGRKRRDVSTDAAALQRLETGDAADRVEEVLRAGRFSRPTDLHLCARAGVELDALPDMLERLKSQQRWIPVAGTDSYAVPAAIDDLRRRLTGWLERYHRAHAEQPGRAADSVLGWLERMTGRALARPLFDGFVKDKTLKILGRFACLPAFAPTLSAADEKLLASMIGEIRKGGFQPPTLETLAVAPRVDRKRRERLATLAVAMGDLVRIDSKIYLHVGLERQLRDKVAELISARGGITVAQLREALDSSRKYVVPFLEYLDRAGFTKRIEDQRVLAET